MHKSLIALGAAVTVGILAAAPVRPATGGTDRTPASALYAAQARLDAAIAQIHAAPGTAEGLGAIVVAPESSRMVLYWKGAVPPSTGRVIDRLRADVSVEVRAARYSAAELGEASRSFAARPGVLSAGPSADGSGIVATATAAALPGIPRTAPVRGRAIPVSVTPGEPATPAACGGRQKDCSPFYGGARMVFSDGVRCSTGLAVNTPGGVMMMSAGHCGINGQTVTNGLGQPMGTVQGDNATRDTLLVRTPQATSAGLAYVGDANSGAAYEITSAARSAVGQLVCTSGSFTGQHCNVQVTAVGQFVTFTGLGTLGPLVLANQTSGGVAVGKGDSGGSVLALLPGATATAKGTITGYPNASIVACPPPPNSASQCGSSVYYVDITDSMPTYQASIITVRGPRTAISR